ncbi:hypothetical protein BDP27DRAFT_1369208 [Rhodocollybia butyracea]|uniref:Uncharacterized protein n=1 Tax=Rhodocollybia butyracea TaxID=206335 RepID=A0A9P5TZX4_9AGAR|nr:hypothetical protein BDP27DRAFT_1369208 [Rhodocollybia butyracea]
MPGILKLQETLVFQSVLEVLTENASARRELFYRVQFLLALSKFDDETLRNMCLTQDENYEKLKKYSEEFEPKNWVIVNEDALHTSPLCLSDLTSYFSLLRKLNARCSLLLEVDAEDEIPSLEPVCQFILAGTVSIRTIVRIIKEFLQHYIQQSSSLQDNVWRY